MVTNLLEKYKDVSYKFNSFDCRHVTLAGNLITLLIFYNKFFDYCYFKNKGIRCSSLMVICCNETRNTIHSIIDVHWISMIESPEHSTVSRYTTPNCDATPNCVFLRRRRYCRQLLMNSIINIKQIIIKQCFFKG